jgi:hypothetical protein
LLEIKGEETNKFKRNAKPVYELMSELVEPEDPETFRYDNLLRRLHVDDRGDIRKRILVGVSFKGNNKYE